MVKRDRREGRFVLALIVLAAAEVFILTSYALSFGEVRPVLF